MFYSNKQIQDDRQVHVVTGTVPCTYLDTEGTYRSYSSKTSFLFSKKHPPKEDTGVQKDETRTLRRKNPNEDEKDEEDEEVPDFKLFLNLGSGDEEEEEGEKKNKKKTKRNIKTRWKEGA